MSAVRTSLLGTALGLAAGAAALAQNADMPTPASEYGVEAETGNTVELPVDGSLGTDMDSTAEAIVETPFPEGEDLAAAADDLIGARVYDDNQEWVGEVSEFLPASGAQDQRVVIDIGGFLGFGETPVEVEADDITVAWTETGEVAHAKVTLTEAELEQMAKSES